MIFASSALLADGWAKNLRITLDKGRIATLTADTQPQAGDTRVKTLLPAPSNLHSHAFQRAMAGLSEHRILGRESFWTWRDVMYRFATRLTPAQVQAIAALAYLEMQEAGFAAVGEFHYLHHGTGGAPYGDLAEMSQRIFAAADQTGIGLTHLPVLYSYGGAGQKPLAAQQARFGNDVDRFARLLQAARDGARALPPDTRVGIAPHSLRATSPADLAQVLPLAQGASCHIHIAEQPAEVADITAWLGASPVAWLLDNADVTPVWCAIHATHMTADETARLARTGAVAGLCPITEANLGDGPFRGPDWLAAGGKFGIGSDSNIRISALEELRTLEYSQRLRDLARNVMVPQEGSVGGYLYTQAALGGAQALGRDAGQIARGKLADLVAIDSDHPALCALPLGQLLDGLVFAAPDGVICDVWSAGRHQVQGGRHIHREAIIADWRRVARSLADDL